MSSERRTIVVNKKTEVISYPLLKRIVLGTKKRRTRALLAFQYATAARAGELAMRYVHEKKSYKYVDGKYVVKKREFDRVSNGCKVASFRVVAAGIRWEAPNFKNSRDIVKTPYVYKQGEPWLYNILVKWIQRKKEGKKKYLFHLRERRIRQLIDGELKRHNKGYSSHILRHSRGTHLAEITENPFVVKEALGHSRLETSQKYIHLTKKEIRAKLRGKSFEDVLGKEV